MGRMLVSARGSKIQRRRTLLKSLTFLSIVGAVLLSNRNVSAQREPSGHRLTITYAGEIIVRFPNFNFYVAGPGHPLTPFRETPTQTRGGAIIWRGQDGSLWDGGSLFISSNYPYDLLLKDRYALRPIGQSTPNPFSSVKASYGQQSYAPYPSVGAVHDPAINPPPPHAGDSTFALKSTASQGLPKHSETGSLGTINMEQDLGTVGSPAHLTFRPTATIVVKPYDPTAILPPRHDALGTLQR